MRKPVLCSVTLLAAAMAGYPAPLAAQESGRPLKGGSIEVSGFAQSVTNGFGDWRGLRLRTVVPVGSSDVLYSEALTQRAFRDNGSFGSLGWQHTYGSDWITFASIGGGTGDFFFPDFRADFSISRKILPNRRILLGVGGSWIESKDVFRDRAVTASFTAYLSSDVVLEAGGRFNWSTPGRVPSQRGSMALTVGGLGRRYVIFRAAGGSEGFQLTGTEATERKFNSGEGSITWREWLSRDFGFVLGGEVYDNPFYTRTGAQVGFFVSW